MTLLEIVGAPTTKALYNAGEHFERRPRLYFTVKPACLFGEFRLYGVPRVLGRRRGSGQDEVIDITFLIPDAGYRELEGRFNAVTRRGKFNCPKNPVLQWLGLDDEVEIRLANCGLIDVEVLSTFTELELCVKLADRIGLARMNRYVAIIAVDRFCHLRSRLAAVGFRSPFKGEQSSRETLVAAMIALPR